MTRLSRTGLLQFIGPRGKTYEEVMELHIRRVLPPPEAYRSGLKALENENRRVLREKGYAYKIPDDNHHRIADRGYSVRAQTCLKEAVRGGDLQKQSDGRYVLTDSGRRRLEEMVSSHQE